MVKDIHGASSSWSSPTVIQIIIPIVEVTFASNIPGATINVDDVDYPVPETFEWLMGTIHNVSVQESIEFTEGGRYFFKSWSDDVKNSTRTITVKNMTLTVIYEVQYLFSYRTRPDNFTSNWYTAGTVISLSAEPPFIDLDRGERLVFKEWSNNASSTVIEITVNESEFIEARWSKQFLLKLNSPYGDLKGEGWYDMGLIVNFSISPSIIELENDTRRFLNSGLVKDKGVTLE
jgi:hypothetical protein